MERVDGWKGFRAVSLALGASLFVFGAVLAFYVLQVVFPLGPASGPLETLAGILFSTYGFSAFLVPCFVLYASILLLIPGWTARAGFILAGSVVPFFTVAGTERFVRSLFAPGNNAPPAQFVVAGIFVSLALALVIEYALLLWLADRYSGASRLHSASSTPFPDTPTRSADDWPEHVDLDGLYGATDPDEPEIADERAIASGAASDGEAESASETAISNDAAIAGESATANVADIAGVADVADETISAGTQGAQSEQSDAVSRKAHTAPVSAGGHPDRVPAAGTVAAAASPGAAAAGNGAAAAAIDGAAAVAADLRVGTLVGSKTPSQGAKPTPRTDEPPTYVDFERMRAPFDLPVVDDWVEQPPEDAIAESDSDGNELLTGNELLVGTDFNDETDAERVPISRGAPAAVAVREMTPEEESEELDDAVQTAAIDDPFEVSFEDLADYEEDAELADSDDETMIEGAEGGEAESPEGLLDDDFPEDDLQEEDILEEDILEDDLLDDVISGDELLEDDIPEDDEEIDGTELPEAMDVPVSRSPASRGKGRHYEIPFDILNTYPDGEYWIIDDATRRAAAALKDTLNEFRIQADVTGIRKGPVITMFEILPAPGVKLSKIVGLQDNIALRLAASSVRIVAPIPGKHAVGIEVPNQRRAIVSFRELIEADNPQSKKMEIPVILGKDITGEAQLLDLATTPHLLIAGSTGAGKSVCVNSIILSILYKRSPQEVKLILIDPKIVELKLYNDIGHLLAPVITEPKKAFQSLQYCLCEMERRYALLDGMGVRDIKSFNRRIVERKIATEKLPYLVVIIDEFADLMATTGKELESTVARLCAMSRAVGIHLVLATQRPSIDVITGLIKANIPSRIAFMVASKMDSRIIIDQVGAEKLLGRGDMLYASATDPFPVRIQGAFVSEEEVERVVEHVKTLGEPEYIDEEIFVDDEEDEEIDPSLFSDGEDPLYEKALEIVLNAGKASASYIQRKLKIGYNRAARLVEDMEARGIVGPANGSKPREVVHRP